MMQIDLLDDIWMVESFQNGDLSDGCGGNVTVGIHFLVMFDGFSSEFPCLFDRMTDVINVPKST